MKRILIFIFIVFLPLIAYATNTTMQSKDNDPIDELVQNLNSDKFGLWVNGPFPCIKLSKDSEPEKVIAQAVKMISFDKGHIKTYKIIEVRRIKLNAYGKVNCSAALIESDIGRKILLFNYVENIGWWTRFYAVPEK